MKTDRDFPHTMDNCFGEDVKCDHCEAAFSGRTEVWVWNEHTACSKACVVQAHQFGERAFLSKPEKDTDLL